jgi:exodeoxyribonuclease VII small subunit
MTEPTFKQAYGTLQQHAETLRTQREPNIDDLLTIVTESVDAYKVCKRRIDAVEKALEQALGSAGVDSPLAVRATAAPDRPDTATGTGDAVDDDIPF